MTVLFGKLENMLHNSLYVNFLLTGLVAQLACYPQPLLRSFLLNTNMVFQPSVKSLLQVGCWRRCPWCWRRCPWCCRALPPSVQSHAVPSFPSSPLCPIPQVLGSVKNKIESFAASQEDFPTLLFKAKKYLIARGKLDWADAPGVMPALRRSETLGEMGTELVPWDWGY